MHTPLPTATDPLFVATHLGALAISHRVVMAPLTRLRADGFDIPAAISATYYAQRATPGGLLISEATQIMPEGKGYPGAPGIYDERHVRAWRTITDAVHSCGGLILLQLWHVGRISHPSLQPGGTLPVAPSAIAADGYAYASDFTEIPFPTPRALELAELPALVGAYAAAARRAADAGFDGVEIHAANGYLLDQFLESGTNLRTDAYGGSPANRARLLLEVVDATIDVWGASRVGVRLSPFGTFNAMHDNDPATTFGTAIAELAARDIAYLHLVEARASEASSTGILNIAAPDVGALFGRAFPGPVVLAGGFTPTSARAAVRAGHADAVAFGRAFIANPDLIRRIREDAPLNAPNRSTFYQGGIRGYTDYPTLGERNGGVDDYGWDRF